MSKTIIHLKGLNGIRAIAALTVVLSHILLQLQPSSTEITIGHALGSYGVTMFFTLSGFLITYLLLKEKKTFGTISIKEFYIRRLLRVWPLYYFYILLVVVIMLAGSGVLPSGIWYYLFLAANIVSLQGVAPPLLEHYWSLGVEEQFYLFWPWLVKYASPLKTISAFLLLFILIKGALRIWMPDSIVYWFMFSSRFDCMAIGALFAILVNAGKNTFLLFCFNKISQLISWSILLLGAAGKFQLLGFLDHDIFSVASAIIILNVAFNNKSLLTLEHKLLNFLGRISYGIYVYHILVVYLLSLFLKDKITSMSHWLQIGLLGVLTFTLTIFIAWLSYEFFEKRFLQLKEKFSRIFSRT